ncbi:SCO2322 family protein [Intrasporangium calvum]|uniref:LPXTG-motif cell wall anchor domain protein n=1 Tax=Intrasporangium calvum (strain ATCC 23552 / DSM 43043 / JCM 3097 / NBRC 12989 / NCIMB 10167 / NRRL B-3866 / 7 KIP) TaxID=710696 RepID=E6SCD9_INTC7|nr:SCO2322 family protein [Intrasporangium calvum]ADU48518.1 hypothetical protein Intca_2007 [Intrasporangium calvum DSM 43043]
MSFAHRVPVRVALAALLAAAISILSLAPAHAAAYRFWGFYQLADGKWAFAQKGPDQIVPEDGSVDGWRFAVADMNDTRFPRATLTFDQVCGSTAAETGKKRVGLVIDFGRPADAADGATPPEPQAICAVVDSTATSTDVLAAAGDLRVENGLVCAVAGYPATDCGGEVKELSAEAKAADTPVQISAPSTAPTTSAAPSAAATAASAPAVETSSGTSTAAYVIAALALLALLIFVVARSRAANRRDA